MFNFAIKSSGGWSEHSIESLGGQDWLLFHCPYILLANERNEETFRVSGKPVLAPNPFQSGA